MVDLEPVGTPANGIKDIATHRQTRRTRPEVIASMRQGGFLVLNRPIPEVDAFIKAAERARWAEVDSCRGHQAGIGLVPI